MSEALTIRVGREQGYATVTVAGEIDIATVARLRERLFELAASGQPLIADLDQVSFIDSAGLAALVGAARRAVAHGASLHVICARPQTRQLLHLTGLDRQIPLARTLDEALESAAALGTAASGPPEQPANWPMISAARAIASDTSHGQPEPPAGQSRLPYFVPLSVLGLATPCLNPGAPHPSLLQIAIPAAICGYRSGHGRHPGPRCRPLPSWTSSLPLIAAGDPSSYTQRDCLEIDRLTT